jgi:hypothetical protein
MYGPAIPASSFFLLERTGFIAISHMQNKLFVLKENVEEFP